MIDASGEEWLPIAQAARRVRIREDLIRQWKARGRVRGHQIGHRETWVNVPDVARAEVAWRRRVKARAATPAPPG